MYSRLYRLLCGITDICLHLFHLTFYWFFDKSCFFYRSKDKNLKKKLLIVRVDAIGDFILWLDSAKEYRRLFPVNEYEVILLGNTTWISLAKALPYFDRVISLNRASFVGNPIYRIRLLLAIRRESFDVVVSPAYSREFLYGDSLVRITGAVRRIGSVGDLSNIHPWTKKISDRWYTLLVPAVAPPLMELLRNAEFLRGLGLEAVQVGNPRLSMSLTLPADLKIYKYYVICPGAGAEARQWPWQSFLGLARRIHQTFGLIGVLCGAKADAELARSICNGANFPLINLVGKTSIEELAALLTNAMFLVGNETGAVHVASAVSTPSICILGGGHYGRFLPYPQELSRDGVLPVIVTSQMNCFNCNWQCSRAQTSKAAAPCISEIDIEEVLSALRPLVRI